MDVGSLFIADAQTPELIQPGEGTLHHPSPPPKTTAMRRAARSQQRENVARPQPSPDHLRVVGAVAQHTVGTTPGSSSRAL